MCCTPSFLPFYEIVHSTQSTVLEHVEQKTGKRASNRSEYYLLTFMWQNKRRDRSKFSFPKLTFYCKLQLQTLDYNCFSCKWAQLEPEEATSDAGAAVFPSFGLVYTYSVNKECHENIFTMVLLQVLRKFPNLAKKGCDIALLVI